MSIEKKIRKVRTVIPPFQNGQIWQMIDSSLRIELVGKRLVHYKHYNLKVKRPNVLLSNKAALEKFLYRHRAVLLPETSDPSPANGAGRKPGAAAAKARVGGITGESAKKLRR